MWQCDECGGCFAVASAFGGERYWCGPLTMENAAKYSKWLRHDKEAAA